MNTTPLASWQSCPGYDRGSECITGQTEYMPNGNKIIRGGTNT